MKENAKKIINIIGRLLKCQKQVDFKITDQNQIEIEICNFRLYQVIFWAPLVQKKPTISSMDSLSTGPHTTPRQ